MTSRPAVASGTLPRTGASTMETPSGSSAATVPTTSGPTVDMSMSNWPGASAAARPSAPSTTCSSASGLATMVSTGSTPAAACAGVDAPDAPRSANGPVFPAVLFQTVRSWPASSNRTAMGVPISPRPTNASFAMGFRPPLHAFRMRAPHRRRIGQDHVDFPKVGGGDFDVGCRGGLVELSRPPRAHGRDVDGRIGEGPCDRELGKAHPPVPGEPLQSLHYGQVPAERLPGEVRTLAAPVVGVEGRGLGHPAGEQTVGQRPVHHDADVVLGGVRQDAVLDVPAEQVVRRLERLQPSGSAICSHLVDV